MPRYLVIVPGNEQSEEGQMPSSELIAEMQKYNEQLVKAGVMLAGEGLKPTSAGVKVRFEGGKRTVVDGPFAETKELIAGFWIFQTKSKEEAVEWIKRAPFDGGTEIVLREIFEDEDFGANLTPELREREAALRAETQRLQRERGR